MDVFRRPIVFDRLQCNAELMEPILGLLKTYVKLAVVNLKVRVHLQRSGIAGDSQKNPCDQHANWQIRSAEIDSSNQIILFVHGFLQRLH